LQATDTAAPIKHHLPTALKDSTSGHKSRWQQACCQDIRLRSAVGPTTFYTILIVPQQGQQCWHQAGWRVKESPLQHCHASGWHPARLPAVLQLLCLLLPQGVTQTLSMRPRLLVSSGLRKCQGLYFAAQKSMLVLDAQLSGGTHLIIPTSSFCQGTS